MKTQLIQELLRPPVATGHRRAYQSTTLPLCVEEKSSVESCGFREVEDYRFDARLGARFSRHPNEPDFAKNEKYHQLLRSVTEAIYGEVRREIYLLLPKIREINDMKLERDFEIAFSRILEMTEPF